MAIQTSTLPPSLVAELADMKRRLSALERRPKLGSQNERLPVGMYQSPLLEGLEGPEYQHVLAAINTTGMNSPVVIVSIPFHIPTESGEPLDVAVTMWLADRVSGKRTREVQLNKSHAMDRTRNLVFSWIHPQPIGWEDNEPWKAIEVQYRVDKRDPTAHVTVGAGIPTIAVGIPLGTYQEEATDGNPRIDGSLTEI